MTLTNATEAARDQRVWRIIRRGLTHAGLVHTYSSEISITDDRYFEKPPLSPLTNCRRPTTYSARIGNAVSKTDASTAGTFTLYCP